MQHYDVIVVGGGPGGLPAAIASARGGMKTLLIERSAALGGLAISALPLLGFVDRAGNHVLGGIPQEFVDRMAEENGTLGHIRCPIHNSLTIINPHWFRIVAFEMCKEANVDVMLYSELMDVKKDGERIVEISALCRGEKRSYTADMFIDCTGDACMAVKAGAECRKNAKLQPAALTFCIGGVNLDTFKAYLKKHPESAKLPDTYGMKQTEEQFFQSRAFTFTGFPELIEKAKRDGNYDLPRDRIIFMTLPEAGQVMVNTTRVNGVDTSQVDSVIEAEFECHRQIKELMHFFRKYAPGFENCYLASISPCLGSRESYRIVGEKTLTTDALDGWQIPDDSVTLAGYNVDVHVPNSELLSLQPVEHAIGIPYGTLVSRNVPNLLVAGRCASVDGDIYGLTRIMGTAMGMGEAAGTAAVMAVRRKCLPREMNVADLRAELVKNGVILSLGQK